MQRFGPYELIKRIAMGGMAEIFFARKRGEAGFTKDLVIKRMLPHYASETSFITMFIDEAVLAAKLDHPNIVTIFDFGCIDGNYFLAMDFVDGFDLKRFLGLVKEHGAKLPLGLAVYIALGIARGLSFAHERAENGVPLGIVHRDVSPHNVLISTDGGVKVMDFGIAKATQRATRTATGMIKGKLAYMSPEQAQGMELDPRSDIFSTGICLWEMLAGRRLFDGNSDMEILRKVQSGECPSLAAIRQDLPAELLALVDKSLARDREVRFQTMREMERELVKVLQLFGDVSSADLSELVHAVAPHQLIADLRAVPEETKSEHLPSVAASAPTTPTSVLVDSGATHLASPPAATTQRVTRPRTPISASVSLAVAVVAVSIFTFVLARGSSTKSAPGPTTSAPVQMVTSAELPKEPEAPATAPSPANIAVVTDAAPPPAVVKSKKHRQVDASKHGQTGSDTLLLEPK